MVKLIDITPVVSDRIAVWPGDTPYTRISTLGFEDGCISLSYIHSTLHLGAHADAPVHYRPGGQGMSERDLSFYFGDCQVIRVDVARGDRVRPRHLPGPIEAPRVLLWTGTFPDPDDRDEDFASLSAELVHHLHEQGVRLIGIDTPSIDLADDKVLESHQAVAEHDMANLEGIVLDHVEPGRYTLIALPLKLEGADAAPVRAVLIEQ